MKLSLTTKSPLGVLCSKRSVDIVDFTYDSVSEDYSQAVKSGKTREAAQARAKIISTYFKDFVKPGEPKRLCSKANANDGKYPGADKLAAVFTWHPEKSCLRVDAEVIDASFSPAPKDKPWTASSVEVLIAPAGTKDTIHQFFIIPDGAGGKAKVRAGANTHSVSGATATWKRTARGYNVDVSIPWKILRGYHSGWNVMPVNGQVNTKAPTGWAQITMNKPGPSFSDARNYALLRAE